MIGKSILNLINAFKLPFYAEICGYSTQLKTAFVDFESKPLTKSELEWEAALPYDRVPGPSKLLLIKRFLPGGKYYKTQLKDLQILLKNEYGNIVRMPGVFGKRDLILTFNPVDFEKIYRTEGTWPVRRGLDAINYYRKIKNPELFLNAGGLISEQGEEWATFRKVVNPVMMQTKTLRLYVPRMDKVANQFVNRIRLIRDSSTNEVPKTFESDINLWTLESIGTVALDADLGLVNGTDKNPDAIRLINAMSVFFQLCYELDVKPSFWKIIKTPTFYKMMNALETVTEVTTNYIEEAMKKLNMEEKVRSDESGEISVLERLLKVNKKIAIVMAMDLMFGGVDSTTSAYVGCLLCLAKNPLKQEILRNELKQILPENDSPLTNENMKSLPYLRACIKEGLRMFPVTAANLRTTGQDIVLQGYRIPKNIDTAMPNVLVHKDETQFSKSKQFIPERWLRNKLSVDAKSECPVESVTNKSANPFAYIPFGFGPRSCIGKRLVDIELEIGIAKLVRNFQIEFDYPDDNIFKTNLINVPNADLRFKFIDI